MIPTRLRALDLPLDHLRSDPNHVYYFSESDPDDHSLLQSMTSYGLLQPLIVHECGANDHVIVDGHRRYSCAKQLGLSRVACIVYPRLAPGDYEYLRIILHETAKPWTKQEWATWRRRYKQSQKMHVG